MENITDKFNDFLLSMVTPENSLLIKELHHRWKEYLNQPVLNPTPLYNSIEEKGIVGNDEYHNSDIKSTSCVFDKDKIQKRLEELEKEIINLCNDKKQKTEPSLDSKPLFTLQDMEKCYNQAEEDHTGNYSTGTFDKFMQKKYSIKI